jgi:hypothetical protein
LEVSFLSKKKNPVASDNMPNPNFILGTHTQITSQPTDLCVRFPLQKRSSHCCHLLKTQVMPGAKGTFSVIFLLKETRRILAAVSLHQKKNMARQKVNCTLGQLQFSPTKVISVACI